MIAAGDVLTDRNNRSNNSLRTGKMGLSFLGGDVTLGWLSGRGLTHSGVDESLCRSHALTLLGSIALSLFDSRPPRSSRRYAAAGPLPSWGYFGPRPTLSLFAAGVRSRAVSLWAVSPRGKS